MGDLLTLKFCSKDHLRLLRCCEKYRFQTSGLNKSVKQNSDCISQILTKMNKNSWRKLKRNVPKQPIEDIEVTFCSWFYDTEAKKLRRGVAAQHRQLLWPSVRSKTEKESESENPDRKALQSGEELVKEPSRHPTKIWQKTLKTPAYHSKGMKIIHNQPSSATHCAFHSKWPWVNPQRQQKIS